MKSFRLFSYIFIFITVVACSFGTETQIHNQLEGTLVVEVNDETYTLIPNRLIDISYSYGENRIKSTYRNKVIVDTIITITREMTEKGALINVTGKPYYLMTERYGGSIFDNPIYEQMVVADSTGQTDNGLASYKDERLQKMLERMKVVVIDSISVIGEIETFPANQIIIPRDWYFNVGSEFTESIEVSNTNESFFGKSVKKIFSEDELLTYWYSQKSY